MGERKLLQQSEGICELRQTDAVAHKTSPVECQAGGNEWRFCEVHFGSLCKCVTERIKCR